MAIEKRTPVMAQVGDKATHEVMRNTYMMLSLTLLFSALMAGVSMLLAVPAWISLLTLGGALVLMWFVLPKTAHSMAGLGVVFAITGLLGFGLGPTLTYYLSMPGGGELVMTAMGGTGAIFLGLSAYTLITRQDFSFMGGFLVVGLVVILLALLGNLFLNLPGLSMALSAGVILLMSGFILYDTSRMIHGGEDNYLFITVSLFLSIFNIFVHLLSLLGMSQND
ncbi:MAG TPA: Bax inhibitor-1/YccA family protein [Halothiobacillaceae bacterium]|nr:Bax inhibitor-1/YccA family protein [Halothiobacillaceae bacterium]